MSTDIRYITELQRERGTKTSTAMHVETLFTTRIGDVDRSVTVRVVRQTGGTAPEVVVTLPTVEPGVAVTRS